MTECRNPENAAELDRRAEFKLKNWIRARTMASSLGKLVLVLSRDRIGDRDSTVILVEDVESLSSPSRVSPSKIRARALYALPF